MDYTNDIYEGQRRINGALCRVDWKLIRALRVIHNVFEELRPRVPQDLLDRLERAINDADGSSARVAGIKPPGCEPEGREDPAYTQAANNSTSNQP